MDAYDRFPPPLPKVDMTWTNKDWIRVYKFLGIFQCEIRKEREQANYYESGEISELMKKLEYMFREEDKNG